MSAAQPPTEAQILDVLRAVSVGDRRIDLVTAGQVSGVAIRSGNVHVAIEVGPERAEAMEPVRKSAERAVAAVPGVLSATVVLTAQRPARPGAASPQRPAPSDGGPAAGGRLSLPGVRSIVAVASGKGGVGKSTVAVNLAVALAQGGWRVGLLDADVYGPSLPRMMGIRRRPDSRDGKRLLPLENHGVRCMSIGFMVEEDTPTIWRGPMVMSALQQMLSDVEWAPLDVLLVDMPPGTGDAQLTMAQRVPLAGAVIVSTPQDIALLDARKGLNMCRRVDVPVLGIVENMSTFVCPNCRHETQIFGHGGARAEAERLGVPFLGEVPLDLETRIAGDSGTPIVAAASDGPQVQAFRRIADSVRGAVEAQRGGAGRQPPRIVIE